MVVQRPFLVDKSWSVVDRFDLDAIVIVRSAFNPCHEEVPSRIAVFQNIAPQLRGDGREHRHIRGPKRFRKPFVSSDVKHGNLQISLRLNIKPPQDLSVRTQLLSRPLSLSGLHGPVPVLVHLGPC